VKVRYTLPALADLDEILDCLAPRSPRGAARVQARIKKFVELLLSHPFMGGRTDDPTIRLLRHILIRCFTRSETAKSSFITSGIPLVIPRRCAALRRDDLRVPATVASQSATS